MIKKASVIILAFITALMFSSCGGAGKASVTENESNLLIKDGSFPFNTKAESDSAEDLFVNLSISEAVTAFAETQNCTEEQARDILSKKDCVIHTAFDRECFNAVQDACRFTLRHTTEFACVLTDINGAVLAIGNSSSETGENITYHRKPHSTIKPLGVYAPALEEKIINWSSVFEDSEYKKIRGSDGNPYGWPANATKTYLNKDVTVEYALKNSLNTVAVKCISKLGVQKSIAFLSTKFGIDLSVESTKAQAYGEEEVIGNIALGAFISGVSPLDMVGYYQIFVNDGSFTPAHFVLSITDGEGKEIYKCSTEKKQVISGQTANIMNNMLRRVVTPDGTGKEAAVAGLDVAGKTGTGDNNSDNWFIGLSPDYLCAVWHGKHEEKNISPKVFSSIFSNINHKNKRFKNYSGIKQAAYCAESGKLVSDGCEKMETGFYTADNMPEKCDVHNS